MRSSCKLPTVLCPISNLASPPKKSVGGQQQMGLDLGRGVVSRKPLKDTPGARECA